MTPSVKAHASASKAAKNRDVASQQSSSGKNGAAFAPPAYGVDFVDRGVPASASVQQTTGGGGAAVFQLAETGSGVSQSTPSSVITPPVNSFAEHVGDTIRRWPGATDIARQLAGLPPAPTPLVAARNPVVDAVHPAKPETQRRYTIKLQIGSSTWQAADRTPEQALESLGRARQRLFMEISDGLAALERLRQLREEQLFTAAISSALGGVSLPGAEIWDVALTALERSNAELRAGHIDTTVALLLQAAAQISGAKRRQYEYREGSIAGAHTAEVGLEVVQTMASAVVTIGTGGLAGVALGAGYGAAQMTARQGSELALGLRSEIDWTGISFDALFGLVTGLVGGALGNKLGGTLFKALRKALPASPELAHKVVEELVGDLVSGRVSSVLHAAGRQVFDAARGRQRLTVEGFWQAIVDTLLDPKQAFLDTLLGAAQRKGATVVAKRVATARGRAQTTATAEPVPSSDTAATVPVATGAAAKTEHPAAVLPAEAARPTGQSTTESALHMALPALAPEPAPVVHTPTPSTHPVLEAKQGGYHPDPGERRTTRAEHKAREGARRWKAAVDKAFEGDITEQGQTQKLTGGKEARVGGKKVPIGDPEQRKHPENYLDTDTVPRQPGETQRQAVARVRQIIGQKLSDIPLLAKHWDAARANTLKKEALTKHNYAKLYEKTRNAFWRRVRRDQHATKMLSDAGFMLPEGKSSAPLLDKVPATVPVADTRVSLDHVLEKAQDSNWKLALDGDNLQLEFAQPNTEREVKQMRHPELR